MIPRKMEYSVSNENLFYYPNVSTTTLLLDHSKESVLSPCTLASLNNMEIKRRMVPLIYLSIIMTFGIPGNILIMFIYTMKFHRKATHRVFVIAIAFTDFLICVLTIPFEIGQMAHEFTFYAEWLCKLGRTLNAIFTTASALILVALSVNRYRRICHPLRNQLSKKQAKKCIAVIACLSILLSWPEGIFTGLKQTYLKNNITGSDCSTDDDYVGTVYPMYYSACILVFYIACMLSLLVMCFLLGRQILKHDRFRSQFSRSNTNNATMNCPSPQMTIKNGMEIFNKNLFTKQKKQQMIKSEENLSPNRTTLDSPMNVTKTALVVSICFLIVFLPYVVIKLLASIIKGNIMAPCKLASALLPTLARTHFINNVANFIIYICMDAAFRRHCNAMIRTCFGVFK